jgi:hypothetical protein
MIERPGESEFASYYGKYIALITEPEVLEILEAQPAEFRRLAAAVPASRETFRYAPGKWSMREVVGHVGDAERVFGYRAFSISRGERQPLPGFDENEYVAASGYDRRPLAELVGEFASLREANRAMLVRLERRELERVGVANGLAISVRALAFIMAGHVRHHLGILRSRYGVPPGA